MSNILRRISTSIMLIAFIGSYYVEASAKAFFLGSDPVTIDYEIDDDVRFQLNAPVEIMDGALITGSVFIDWANPFKMTGGVIEGNLAGDTSLTIEGGRVKGLVASDWPIYTIKGGLIEESIFLGDESIMIFYGSSFNFPFGNIQPTTGQLTGILEDGTPLSVSFERRTRANILLRPIPEPATVILTGVFTIGSLLISRRP